jgi:hypothetical protein
MTMQNGGLSASDWPNIFGDDELTDVKLNVICSAYECYTGGSLDKGNTLENKQEIKIG